MVWILSPSLHSENIAPLCTSQSDTQPGSAGAAAADEEVGLFPQLIGKALSRGCEGECRGGDGARGWALGAVTGGDAAPAMPIALLSPLLETMVLPVRPWTSNEAFYCVSIIPWLQMCGQVGLSPIPKAGVGVTRTRLHPSSAGRGTEYLRSVTVQENCTLFIFLLLCFVMLSAASQLRNAQVNEKTQHVHRSGEAEREMLSYNTALRCQSQ